MAAALLLQECQNPQPESWVVSLPQPWVSACRGGNCHFPNCTLATGHTGHLPHLILFAAPDRAGIVTSLFKNKDTDSAGERSQLARR